MQRVGVARARRAAAIAGAAYLAALVVVPLVDRETDVLRAHPEHYADGVAGPLVRIGYGALALMTFAIAAAVLRGVSRTEPIAAVLLGAGAATSLVLAAVPQEVTGGPLFVGVMALALAPLLVSFGRWGRLPSVVVGLGAIVTVGFLVLIVLPPRDVAGIANRSWDVLLAGWGCRSLPCRGRDGRS